MEIWHSILEARNNLNKPNQRTVVTIGNFDGVHRGHQAIMQRTCQLAQEKSCLSVVLTFVDHSEVILGERPFLINNKKRRYCLLEQQNVDVLLEIPFNQEFANISAEDFVSCWLKDSLHAQTVVVGYDFKFGSGGFGDYLLLQEMGKEYGFSVEKVAPVYENNQIISSSKIRQLLAEGQLESANKMLGYCFTIEGEVAHGEQIARKLGFPTANVFLESKYLLPCYGVYLVKLYAEDAEYYGLANVGIKPTFGEHKPIVEVYLFDVELNLYEQSVKIEFLQFIRPENRFSGAEALRRQIEQDVARAKEFIH